jgi:hypothetical protein
VGTFLVELSISDPWEVASCVTSPLRGCVVQFGSDSVLLRLDEPILINGILISSARVTPRHVGVNFKRSARSVAANIVLSAGEPSTSGDLGCQQSETVQGPCIAAIGAVSFMECQDG